MEHVPDDVDRYLAAVSTRVAGVLGAQLVGLYTSGSLALGDYRPGRSDVDLMAVVIGPTSVRLRRQLVGQLDHRVLPCPAAGLEFVLYPLATVRSPTLAAGYLLNLNTGQSLPPLTSFDPGDAPAFWYPIDRAVTRQSGAALLGPPARQVIAPLPFDDLMMAVIMSMEAHREPAEHDLLDNAVLNACRALRFAQDRHWYAKLDAAEQTLPTAGQFTSVVHEAMTSFRSGRHRSTTLTLDAVRAFIGAVLDTLRSVAVINAHRASA